jgi:hypothetical protein
LIIPASVSQFGTDAFAGCSSVAVMAPPPKRRRRWNCCSRDGIGRYNVLQHIRLSTRTHTMHQSESSKSPKSSKSSKIPFVGSYLALPVDWALG